MPSLRTEIRALANPKKAKILQGFFKTGKGEYGEGDKFLGVTVPETRRIAKKFADEPLASLKTNLSSKYHEERLAALLVLVEKFKAADQAERKKIFDFYLANRRAANNWDLVDLTADKIVGEWLCDKDKALLFRFSKSKNLWERRIAVLATYAFIRRGRFEETFRLAEQLLDDEEDLMHKAVGWMLREVGKRDPKALEQFLRHHCKEMPRTMLRYAIERFPEKKRRAYLTGSV